MTTHTRDIPAPAANSDAWRARIQQYMDMYTAAGLKRVVPSGQNAFDPSAISWPGNAASPLGSVWYAFDDDMQESFPIFIRVDFRTPSNSSGGVSIVYSVGSEMADDGTFTKIIASPQNSGVVDQAAVNLARRFFLCHTDGFFGLACTVGASAVQAGPGTISVCRTVDANGQSNGNGVLVMIADASTAASPYFSSARRTEAGYQLCYEGIAPLHSVVLQPFGHYTTVEGEIPTYLVCGLFPDIQPVKGVCGLFPDAMSYQDTFKVAVVGNTPRNYINLGRNGYFYHGSSTSKNAALAMLWE